MANNISTLNEHFFSGKKLYGDDFNLEEITNWYKEEEEGYANLGSNDKKKYSYQYAEMDREYCFKYINKADTFEHAMGLGSAYGHEFLPLINQIQKLTIVEPSEQLRSEKLGNLKPNYVKPQISGELEFENDTFDLIVCFSVLHHIPNVTYVLSEIYRVLKPNGILLIREPIVTMGDWQKPRKGLTKNERGIPKNIFSKFIEDKKLEIISQKFSDCAFLYKGLSKLFKIKHNSSIYQKTDKIVSKLLSWNYKYHRKNTFQKIAPSSIILVLRK
jgi:SAM-dependent methyltransferase